MAQAAAPPATVALFAGAELDLLLWTLVGEMKVCLMYKFCMLSHAAIIQFSSDDKNNASNATKIVSPEPHSSNGFK
jgi:hypothetical protein